MCVNRCSHNRCSCRYCDHPIPLVLINPFNLEVIFLGSIWHKVSGNLDIVCHLQIAGFRSTCAPT